MVAAVTLTACGEDDEGPIVGGAAAPDETVTEDLEVNSLQLAFPEDGLHEEGDDVTLYAALTNTGTTAYRLVDVVGPDFADASLVALDGSEGAIEVPENDNAYLQPEGPPSVILQDLETSLRSSQSIEVTFVFEGAGEITMEAAVAAESPADGSFEAPQDPTDE
jgi:copper(I)-binding protein